MNSSEKKLAKKQLTEEQKVLKALKSIYKKALDDVQKNIADLNSRTDMQNLQSIIYQKKYQEALETQIKTVLDNLNNNSYQTIEDYVKDSYVNGYVGNMWLLQQQTGLTCVVPIDERKVVRAYTNDSKISTRYYSQNNPLKGRIAEDIDLLKARIKSNISRGIASGKSWIETAYDIASGMNSVFSKAMNDAMRIARTEGHRVNQQGFLDAGQEAINNGAEIVKQWDATLDSVTRPWHQEADGQIREWDEKFLVGGEEMDAPSIGGSAFNVCNCRCQLLQRAKWALDEDELQELEDRANFFGLDKTKDIDDFKDKYLQLPKNADKIDITESSKAVNALDQCKTVEDVEGLLKNSGWYYETTINGKLIRSVDGLSLQGADFECAKMVYITQEKLFTKYPELIGKLNSMNVAKLDRMTYADCMVGLGHGGVRLNSQYFGDVGRLMKYFEKDVEAGFHPLGVGAESIITHEFGHALDDLLTNTYFACGTIGKSSRRPKWVSSYLRPKVMKACGLMVGDIGKEVSGYATKDAQEWFAECFCEWMESSNPRPVAKEFGKQLEELMKGVDWNANA